MFSLTLLHPVGCDSALLLWPTTVLHIFLQRKQRLMSPTVPCPHCFQLWWRSVWSGHRRVPRWHVVQEGGSIRHVRAELDQNTAFSERLVPDALKGPGKEIVSRYSRSPKNPALQQLQKSSKSASTTPQRPIWISFATVGVRDFRENGCKRTNASFLLFLPVQGHSGQICRYLPTVPYTSAGQPSVFVGCATSYTLNRD